MGIKEAYDKIDNLKCLLESDKNTKKLGVIFSQFYALGLGQALMIIKEECPEVLNDKEIEVI